LKNILYIISRKPSPDWPFPEFPENTDTTINVIFIQEAVNLQSSLTYGKHFTLKEDMPSKNNSSSFPSIGYHDMLRMIFEANTVISI
jgi:hypothetical protein